MQHTLSDLQTFYYSRSGRLVRRLISSYIDDLWSDIEFYEIFGYGYANPYLRVMTERAKNTFSLMPSVIGACFWPEPKIIQDRFQRALQNDETNDHHKTSSIDISNHKKGRSVLLSDDTLPFETESIDRLIVVHSLEHSELLDSLLSELWRLLKSNGRIIFIVPNRHGLWARADWTPFGWGRPFTKRQIVAKLSEHNFVYQKSKGGLFVPPYKSLFVSRTAYAFERLGRYVFPGLCGIHLIEVSKKVYAGTTVENRKKNYARRYVLSDTPA